MTVSKPCYEFDPMAIPAQLIVHQIPNIVNFTFVVGKALFASYWNALRGVLPRDPVVPGTLAKVLIPPRPLELNQKFREWSNLPQQNKQKTHLHPLMFSQWIFSLMAENFKTVEFPLHHTVFQGCKIQFNGQIPVGENIASTSQLIEFKQVTNPDTGKTKKRVVVAFTSETQSSPKAIQGELVFAIPVSGKRDNAKKQQDPLRVPRGASSIGHINFGSHAGVHCALLIGDFNPIHWLKPYAQALGFRRLVLHGYGQLAQVMGCIVDVLCNGDEHLVSNFNVNFTRPLELPSRATVWVEQITFSLFSSPQPDASHKVWLTTDKLDGSKVVHMVGTFQLREN